MLLPFWLEVAPAALRVLNPSVASAALRVRLPIMDNNDKILALQLVANCQARQRASDDAKLLVLRLVALQARLHGNYAAVRRALPSQRQQAGRNRVANDLEVFRAISNARHSEILVQHDRFQTLVSIIRNSCVLQICFSHFGKHVIILFEIVDVFMCYRSIQHNLYKQHKTLTIL